MRPKLIAIEGIDGVGKSYLVSQLSKVVESDDVFFVKTPFGLGKDLVSVLNAGLNLEKFLVQFLANLTLLEETRKYKWVIMDRFVLTTLVYHRPSIIELQEIIFKIIKLLNITPDYTIFLKASLDTIDSRLKNRNSLSNHSISSEDLETTYDELLNHYLSKYYLGELYVVSSENDVDLLNNIELIRNIIQKI